MIANARAPPAPAPRPRTRPRPHSPRPGRARPAGPRQAGIQHRLRGRARPDQLEHAGDEQERGCQEIEGGDRVGRHVQTTVSAGRCRIKHRTGRKRETRSIPDGAALSARASASRASASTDAGERRAEHEVRVTPAEDGDAGAVRVRRVEPVGLVPERRWRAVGRAPELTGTQIVEEAAERCRCPLVPGETATVPCTIGSRAVRWPPDTRSAGTNSAPFASSKPSPASRARSASSRANASSLIPGELRHVGEPGRRVGRTQLDRHQIGRLVSRRRGVRTRDDRYEDQRPSATLHRAKLPSTDARPPCPAEGGTARPPRGLHPGRDPPGTRGSERRALPHGLRGNTWRFDGFLDFIQNYTEACALLNRPDFRRLAEEFCADLAIAGVPYAEAVFSPANHAARLRDWFGPIEAVLDGLEAGRRDHGVVVRVCPDVVRDLGMDEAERTLEVATKFAGQGVVALNAAGSEASAGRRFRLRVRARARRRAALSPTPESGADPRTSGRPSSITRPTDRSRRPLDPDPRLLEVLAARGIPWRSPRSQRRDRRLRLAR